MQNDKWPSRFTCALTGYGCRTNKEASIVEAANIHSFSKSQNGESRSFPIQKRTVLGTLGQKTAF